MYELHLTPGQDIALKKISEEIRITRQVKKFYENIQFPGRRPMEQDSLIFLRKFSNIIKQISYKHRPVRVLDAGCGTGNTCLSLAAQFRDVQFTGIDLSSTSIVTAQKCANEANLSNVSFCEWNLLDKLPDEEQYNIILCFGVLHHTAEMQKVLKNLYFTLARQGTLFLWVYGKYGRYLHSLNVELLSILLGNDQLESDVLDFTREFILKTQNGKIISDLLGERSEDQMLKKFYTDRTWIADQFLNPNELMVNMKDLISLCNKTGFKIEEWVGVPKDIGKLLNSAKLVKLYYRLSDEQQLIVQDLLLKMDRYFLVLHK